jgi:hypothetical protein
MWSIIIKGIHAVTFHRFHVLVEKNENHKKIVKVLVLRRNESDIRDSRQIPSRFPVSL